MADRIITLLTDFGTRDPFVASMKGVINCVNPDVNIIDITHEVAPHDIFEAGFILRSCYSFYPIRTIHVVVIDPTVGSSRKILLLATENYYFIAPDNGVLSLIYSAENVNAVIEITGEHYFQPEISNTFHGRDIIAPAAAWLAKGTDIMNFGAPTDDYVKLALPKSRLVGQSLLKGNVIHIDRFGNLITNISRQDYGEARAKVPGEAVKIVIAKQEISGMKEFYSQGEKGELMAIFGSTNFLEVSLYQGSAAKTLGLSRGAEVGLLLK